MYCPLSVCLSAQSYLVVVVVVVVVVAAAAAAAAAERQSLAGELTLFCARPAADW